jgi:hypothetical protein
MLAHVDMMMSVFPYRTTANYQRSCLREGTSDRTSSLVLLYLIFGYHIETPAGWKSYGSRVAAAMKLMDRVQRQAVRNNLVVLYSQEVETLVRC